MTHAKLVGLMPARVLEIFSDVLGIPRPSHKEDQMVAYIGKWADARGFTWKVDDAKNVVVFVPATAGLEDKPTLCLQGHTDMVCVGATQWPIDIDVQNDWVMTLGQTQTLGADNGLGCAMMMALCDGPHGPLELLFTSDEEDDFTGCGAFRREFFGMKSEFLVNLDTPHDGRITIASAGFRYIKSRLLLERSEGSGKCFRFMLDNMPGGHSGEDPQTNRGNSLKLMGLLLSRLPVESRLITMDGGEKGNSIPKACMVTVMVPQSTNDFSVLMQLVENARETLRCPGISFDVTPVMMSDMKPLTAECHDKVVTLLRTIPSGIVEMSLDLEDLPLLSSTLSLVKAIEGEDALLFTHQVRGSTEPQIDGLVARLMKSYATLGCWVTLGYSGRSWIQDPNHPLVRAVQHAFEQTGYPGMLSGNHGAIEPGQLCGDPTHPQFKAAISFGVWIRDEHKETERFYLPSLQRTFAAAQYLVANPQLVA